MVKFDGVFGVRVIIFCVFTWRHIFWGIDLHGHIRVGIALHVI